MTTATPAAAPPRSFAKPSAGVLFRACIAKEFRQHALTGVVLLGVIALLAAIAAFFQWQFNNGYFDVSSLPNILFLPSTQIVVTFTLPGVAFLLGIVQLRSETSLEMWAFLIHRPTSRLWLFAGRTVGGLLLLSVILGIPLALLFAFSTTTYAGQFFNWRFLLPSLADFLTAFVYYFAGVLVAQHQGRLLGPRLLPLIAAISCSYFVYVVSGFPVACLIIAIYAAVFLIAAAGSFQSHGFALKEPAVTRAARMLIAAVSFTVLLYSPLLFVHDVLADAEKQELQNLFAHPYPAWLSQPHISIGRTLLADGTLANRIYATAKGKSATFYTTLDGLPLPFAAPTDYSDVMLQFHPYDAPDESPYHTGYRDLGNIFTVGEASHYLDGQWLGNELWFYVFPARLVYIYDKKGHAFVGTLGQNGFAPPGSSAKPFDTLLPPPYRHIYPMVTAHAVYDINKNARTVAASFTTIPGERIINATISSERDRSILTNKRFIDDSGPATWQWTSIGGLHAVPRKISAAHVTLPITHPLDQFDVDIQRFPDAHRWSVWYSPAHPHESYSPIAPEMANAEPRAPEKNFVEMYNDQSKLIQQTTLDWVGKMIPPLKPVENPREEHIIHSGQWILGLIDGIASHGPAIFFGILYQMSPHRIAARYLAASFASSAFFAIFTFLLARLYRRRFAGSLVWTLCTLIFGLPILLTFLAVYRYPRRVRCPACHKSRPLPAPRCPHCDAPWPAPPLAGTEILPSQSLSA